MGSPAGFSVPMCFSVEHSFGWISATDRLCRRPASATTEVHCVVIELATRLSVIVQMTLPVLATAKIPRGARRVHTLVVATSAAAVNGTRSPSRRGTDLRAIIFFFFLSTPTLFYFTFPIYTPSPSPLADPSTLIQ